MAFESVFKDYYYLTKPGIIYGNLFTASAGFLLACRWHIKPALMIATLLGIALVIGSACVFNNYIDRGIDEKMTRTKKRALVTGTISGRNALIYATFLGILGFVILARGTNYVTVVLGIIGFLDYILLYGLSKRRYPQGTLVGSIAGAIPPAAGYTAVTGHIDGVALILFFILVFWQMPHFYAISIYRYDDYKKAGLPVLPLNRNIGLTKLRIMLYILAFTFSTMLMYILGYAGYVYLAVVTMLGLIWFGYGVLAYNCRENKLWGRKMFLSSLIVICAVSVAISLASILP